MQRWHRRLALFYSDHRRQLYSYALQVVRCPQRAEDAVHDAFAKLLSSPHRPLRLKAYVFRAVRNAALDLRSRESSLAEPLEALRRIHGANDSSAPPEPDIRERLIQALAGLEEAEREVILLRLHGQMRFRQMARMLSEPIGTVATRYRRAILKLRQEMEEP